jgi:hypothetical protein
MAITVLTQAPTKNLTTLYTVKAELGIAQSDSDDDEVLEGMIARASNAIALECGRSFWAERVTETLKGSRSTLLRLSRYPIVDLEQILEDSLPITDYVVEDPDLGAVYRQVGWKQTSLGGWDSVAYTSGYILPGESAYRYIATYTGGYLPPDVPQSYLATTQTVPPLPGALQECALATVKQWFNEKEGSEPSLGAVRLGTLSVTYSGGGSQSSVLPSSVVSILRHFKAVL